MRIKMCLSILLVLLTTFIIAIPVRAADSDIFSITDATGKQNDEVTVYINLDKELEFAAADLTIEYDKTKLEYVNYTQLEILNKSAMHIVNNNDDTGKIAIGYVSNPNPSDLIKNPGQVLSITFRIKTDTEETTKLNMVCTSLKTDAGESINVASKQSTVTILAQSNNNSNNNSKSNNSNNNNVNGNNNTSYNNNSSNSNTNNSYSNNNKSVVNNNSETNNNENNTNAKTTLPKTGLNLNSIILMIVISLIICCYCLKQIYNLKGI